MRRESGLGSGLESTSEALWVAAASADFAARNCRNKSQRSEPPYDFLVRYGICAGRNGLNSLVSTKISKCEKFVIRGAPYPIRVAMVASSLRLAGAEKQTMYMARALHEAGIDVRFFYLGAGGGQRG